MAKDQLNLRLPDLTHQQIKALCDRYGLTKTQLVILAVDRLSRDASGIPQHRPDRDAELIKNRNG